MRKFKFKVLDSTNKKAILLLKQNTLTPFVVVSDELTCGKGRNNKAYYCPKGGLWFTYIIDYDPSLYTKYSLFSAMAIVDVLKGLSIEAGIKWPNDVYVKGRKICGILLKLYKPHIFIGIGVNTNIKNFPSNLAENSTSVFIERGKLYDNQKVLDDFLEILKKTLHSPALSLQNVRSRLLWIGQKVKIETGGSEVTGIFEDINDEGFAVIDGKVIYDGHLRLVEK